MASAGKFVARIFFEREDSDVGYMDSKPLSRAAASDVASSFSVPPACKTVVAVDANYVAAFNAHNKKAPRAYGHLAMKWSDFTAPKVVMAVPAPLARPMTAVRKAA